MSWWLWIAGCDLVMYVYWLAVVALCGVGIIYFFVGGVVFAGSFGLC